MQVTETSNSGLKRALKVTIPAAELNTRFNDKLNEVKDSVNLKCFARAKCRWRT